MLLESGEMIVNSIRCGGHRACNVWTGLWDVRVATHLQACLELRSDSGIYGVSLKLFGPFPLAPGLMKHVLVSSSGEPGPACGPPPQWWPTSEGPEATARTTRQSPGLSEQEVAMGPAWGSNFMSTKAEIA